MLSSPGDIHVKNLTFTLYCGGVCGGRGRNQSLARLVLNRCGIAVPEIFGAIREDSLTFVSLRTKSLLIVKGRKKYCLREQTYSSELQLVFVNHSRQIVLDRQI